MPANFPSSDRIRLESQERLDLPDAVGIQQMVDEAVQRHFGALLGQGSGLVSPPKLTWDANTKLLLHGPFQYYLASPKALMTDDGGATWKGWNGGFFDFNPTASGQTPTVDLSSAFAAAMVNLTSAAALPFIYAQPVKIDQDLDGRKKWQGGAEASVALLTRTRIRTAFKVVASDVSQDDATNDGWACIGKVTSWSGNLANPGTPTVSPVSYFDSAQKVSNLSNQTVETWPYGSTNVGKLVGVLSGQSTLAGIFSNVGKSKDVGILQLLAFIRDRLQMLQDSTKTRTWYSDPKSTDGLLVGGLTQVLDLIQPRVPTPIVGAAARVVYNAGYTIASSYNTAANVTVSGVGAVSVAITAVPSGYAPAWVAANGNAGAPRIVGTDIVLAAGVYSAMFSIADAAGTFVDSSFSFTVFFKKV